MCACIIIQVPYFIRDAQTDSQDCFGLCHALISRQSEHPCIIIDDLPTSRKCIRMNHN